ncbi:MAG: hypothetical protein K6T83_12500 [Alicyclobacillus sp.]|nr:hypothetical protein [Alicyclobacillus sp.]
MQETKFIVKSAPIPCRRSASKMRMATLRGEAEMWQQCFLSGWLLADLSALDGHVWHLRTTLTQPDAIP